MWRFCHFINNEEKDDYVMLQSYLNMLKITQMTGEEGQNNKGLGDFAIKVKAVQDEDIVQKVTKILII
jgi:hypothetical protein